MRLIILALVVLFCVPVAHGVNYFCDSSKTGTNTYTCTDTTNAATSLDSLLTDLYTPNMAAGDTVFVRSSHAETLLSNIEPNADGTATAPIVVWGDDGTKGATGNGPWPNSTLDSTPPTLTCNANYIYLYTNDYWHIHNIKFDTISIYGLYVRHYDVLNTKITNCTFTNLVAIGDYGLYLYGPIFGEVSGCSFDGGGTGVGLSTNTHSGRGVITKDCTFDDLYKGVYGNIGDLFLYDCVFGNATANTYDVHSRINTYMVSCTANTTLFLKSYGGRINHYYLDDSDRPSVYYIDDDVTVASDHSIVNSGSDYSLKIKSTSAIWSESNRMQVTSYSVDCDSAEARTYSIAAWRDVNWPAPTAAELYLEATYWSADTLATSVSTATLDSDSTWYDLTVADVTPNHDGPVMLTLWLKDYDSDGYIYIDPKLEATGEDYNPTYHWGVPSLAYNYVEPVSGGGQIIIWN